MANITFVIKYKVLHGLSIAIFAFDLIHYKDQGQGQGIFAISHKQRQIGRVCMHIYIYIYIYI